MYSIEILDPQGQSFAKMDMNNGQRLYIGRSRGKQNLNDIQLPSDVTVMSRNQCSLQVVDGCCYLQDEHSAGGTKVNG